MDKRNISEQLNAFLVFLSFIAKLCVLVTVVTEILALFRKTCPVFGKYKHTYKKVPYLKQHYLNIPFPECLRK